MKSSMMKIVTHRDDYNTCKILPNKFGTSYPDTRDKL